MHLSKTIVSFATVLLVVQISSQSLAQSGSRGGRGQAGGGGTGGGVAGGRSTGAGAHLWSFGRRLARLRQIIEAQELASRFDELTQQAFQQQQAQLLDALGTQPDGTLNRRLNQLAFDEAKREYTALVRMQIPVSAAGRQLQQAFRLSSRDVNRSTRVIHWPETLLATEHAELIQDIESKVDLNQDAANVPAEDFIQAIEQLSLQLGHRAVAREISSREYARAKRFLTGLAHEVNAAGGMQ